MNDEDGLGWVKFFNSLSIFTAAGAYVFMFHYFSSGLDFSPWVGLALAGIGFLSGCVAVLFDLKFGIKESFKAVLGILISIFYPLIFYSFKDLFSVRG